MSFELSCEIEIGLKNGTSAPYLREISLYLYCRLKL